LNGKFKIDFSIITILI